MIAVDAAMTFRQSIGGDADIEAYLKQLAWDGLNLTPWTITRPNIIR